MNNYSGERDATAMNSVVGSLVPSADVTSRATTHEVSLFRLYALRASYLLIAVGLGVYIWPGRAPPLKRVRGNPRDSIRLAGWSWCDGGIGASISSANVAVTALRADMEGGIPHSFWAAAMVRSPDNCGGGRRYQSLSDGCCFYSPNSMALCVRALRLAAWRPVEIRPGNNDGARISPRMPSCTWSLASRTKLACG
jgi:hypothetical protein